MKKYFLAGLVLLLPITLTFIIISFTLNLFTNPFVGILQWIFKHYGFLQTGISFLSADQLQILTAQFLILGLLLSFICLLGWITRWVFFHYFLSFGEAILHKIPLFNTIYKVSQDVVKTVFTDNTNLFKQVVSLPFPNKETRSIGILTQNDLSSIGQTDKVAVFVPTTPNPTSGFLIFVKTDDLEYLDMTIEQALKYIVSCGVLNGSVEKEIP